MKVSREQTATAAKTPAKTAEPKTSKTPAFSRAQKPAVGSSPKSDFTRASSSASHVSTRLIDNQQYLPELMSLLDGAKKSINIAQYNMYSETGDAKAITDKLIALKAKNPKLAINVFMEGDHGDGATRNQATAARLKAAGINVQYDSNNLITHEKVVSVDGSKVLAGSHNMTNTSMDKNNEVSLSINSPALAKAYDKYFQQLQSDPSNLHPSTVKSGNVTMITDTAYEGQLLDVIKNAKTSLDASMYDFNFTPGDPKAQEIMGALKDAVKRGVKVNLWLEQSGDKQLEGGITANNQAAARALQAAGATVHLDDPDQISHQKFIVKDSSEVLMGSTNWTQNDFDKRHQVNWRVQDSALATQLKGILQHEIDTESKPPVTPS
jgi:phosphatidylserine/phosphatidylglycerophosphate/cardiolipin synthase-like enzyme